MCPDVSARLEPIDMPGPGAPAEQVVAFLSHQLSAMTQHVNATTDAETRISQRLTSQTNEMIRQIKASCEEKIDTYRSDADRFRLIRSHVVKVRKLGISATGIELDNAIDRIQREQGH